MDDWEDAFQLKMHEERRKRLLSAKMPRAQAPFQSERHLESTSARTGIRTNFPDLGHDERLENTVDFERSTENRAHPALALR